MKKRAGKSVSAAYARFRAAYDKNRSLGLCVSGDGRKVPSPKNALCATCASSKRKNRSKRLAEGRCLACNQIHDGSGVKCNDCKQRHLAFRFGLSVEECKSLFAESKCSVCDSKDVMLVIDHDHDNGAIRGVICKQCNIALGGARDNVETLRRLIEYLSDPPAQRIIGRVAVKRYVGPGRGVKRHEGARSKVRKKRENK